MKWSDGLVVATHNRIVTAGVINNNECTNQKFSIKWFYKNRYSYSV